MNRHQRRADNAMNRPRTSASTARRPSADESLTRKSMLEHNTEAIDLGFQRAVRAGMKAPVIYVVDVREPEGRMLAAQDGKSDAEIDAVIASFAKLGQVPTLVVAFEREVALCIERDPIAGHPGAASVLATYRDEDCFPIVCIAARGCMGTLRPKPQVVPEAFDN